jgi:hypothetical protein
VANVHVLPWALQCIRASVTKYSRQGLCACAIMPRHQRGHEPVGKSVGVWAAWAQGRSYHLPHLGPVRGCRPMSRLPSGGNQRQGGDGCVGLLLRFLPFGPSLSCSIQPTRHHCVKRANSYANSAHDDVNQSAWRQLCLRTWGRSRHIQTSAHMLHNTVYLPARRPW